MSALLSELKGHGFVLPDFKNSNLEVAKQLMKGKGDMIGDKRKKLFLILDGFGYNLMKDIVLRNKAFSGFLEKADVRKITTTYPSFTIPMLASIDSASTVAEHGVTGEEIYVKEAGTIISTLGYCSTSVPDARLYPEYADIIFPKPRMIETANKRQKLVLVQDERIIRSEYSRHTFRDTDAVPYISFEDMLYQVAKELRSGKHGFIYSYHDIIDHSQHVYTPDVGEIRNVVESALHSINRILLPALKRSEYNLVLTADHGQVSLKKNDRVEFGPSHELSKYLTMPPFGQSRAPILSVMPGREKVFEDYFHKNFRSKGMLVESDEAIKSGLFGKKTVSDKLRSRFGTHMIIVRDKTAFKYKYPGKIPRFKGSRFGTHGGLSKNEMEIPLIIY